MFTIPKYVLSSVANKQHSVIHRGITPTRKHRTVPLEWRWQKQTWIFVHLLVVPTSPPPMPPPHVLVDFVVLPPGHGRSVTDFWGWDAHEAQLRCPDDVSGDSGRCSARRALKPKFYQHTQTMVTAGILPFRENSHGRAGNRTRDLMISSQRLWPLDHEAVYNCKINTCELIYIFIILVILIDYRILVDNIVF